MKCFKVGGLLTLVAILCLAGFAEAGQREAEQRGSDDHVSQATVVLNVNDLRVGDLIGEQGQRKQEDADEVFQFQVHGINPGQGMAQSKSRTPDPWNPFHSDTVPQPARFFNA